jgi:FAD/FMN-containing dehydrogenase
MLPRLRADDLGVAARMRVFVWNREAWRVLANAKQRYDPDNVFASGPELSR